MKGARKVEAIAAFLVLASGLLPAMALLLPYGQRAVLAPAGQTVGLGTLARFPGASSPPLDVLQVIRGDSYRRQGAYHLAVDAYLTALAYDNTNPDAYFGQGEAAFWLGRWQEALRAFETSLRYGYAQPALAYRGMGWAHFNLGAYEPAARAFWQAATLAPDLADAYNGLGWVAIQEGDCDRAVSFLEQAVSLDPDFPEAHRGLERCAGVPGGGMR